MWAFIFVSVNVGKTQFAMNEISQLPRSQALPLPCFKLCTHEYYVQKIKGEGEHGTELCPSVTFPAFVGQEFN